LLQMLTRAGLIDLCPVPHPRRQGRVP
jgi:hypothetical protein